MPGYAQETFLAGARVDRQYGLGPLPRVAMMAVLISRAGTCTVAFRYDTASFTAAEQLEKCLQAGFDEIVELGRSTRPVRHLKAQPATADLMTGPLRLPGSVAEIDASPPGPRVGAFFDLDGTLVAGFTVAAVTRDRLRRREVGAAEFLQMMQLAVEYRLGRGQFENVIAGAVRSTKGRLAEDVEEVGERIFRQSVVGPHLPGDARAGPRPPAPRPHRGAELVGADHAGRAGGPLPRHRPRGVQQVRGRRGRRADRRGPAPGDLGHQQGHQRAEVRRRARDRPAVQLLLRGRRRGPRPDAPGRQPAAGQPRAGADQGGRAARLAHPAVQQPGRRRRARPGPQPGRDRLARPGGGRAR